ncbi:2-C-methyl-D-erythritol 4-phosphate cytidylyltransferase [Pseudoalteromonas xiamenensis]|uniref:2-C-methyl-D-erythritol 4-phosphate cytidylyltransferase n=1 Tax=Pseudoalteromonas xiamenensis TaxID=882626 RepID=UPI0027E44ABE|nr:2-C-methyl-D-erythritol 4-phosphate cytidylyltransferase [Pseudoalteromonas xiamenensis]WMN59049.1 2-C-methyl-D-erythritol 4-phosphate cytidylyltransferase [Pseudoalteromonas xiamenensis]
MKNRVKIAAVIPAAGVGSRMQLNFPKQYLVIQDQTILEHTTNKLLALPCISTVLIAISHEDEYFSDISFSDTRVSACLGGASRAESVFNALQHLRDDNPDWVLVHDAARPLVQPADISTLITQCLENDEGGILASRVKDTIKQGDTNIEKTVPRERLWSALTPQMFKFGELLAAIEQGLKEAPNTITDEASAMERLCLPVQLVSGRSDNIKITSPEDYELACYLLDKQKENAQ